MKFYLYDDIILLILKHLEKDLEGLKACTLTCSNFLVLSSPIVWKNLHWNVDFIYDTTSYKKILELFNSTSLHRSFNIKYIKMLTLNFTYGLSFEIADLGLSTNTGPVLSCILKILPFIKNLVIILDVDFQDATSSDESVYIMLLTKLFSTIADFSNTDLKVELVFGEHSSIIDATPILPNILSIASKINVFRILSHTGYWMPSRITQLIELIGPLKCIHLENGARIQQSFNKAISLHHGDTLRFLIINKPDFGIPLF